MDIPRLHPDTIEQVKQRADIVDVVSEHVVLRKQGKDFVGLCPFHDDKSPSFSVSPSKQFYYCFSCGAGGNTIKFLMELGKHSFSDVVLDLARRYQVPVKTMEPEQRQELQRQLSVREQLYEILSLTAKFYEHALRQSTGQQALQYLQSSRQLSEATIQQFQLGYAPAGWETLYGYLVDQKHYPVELVDQAGLIVPRKTGGGYYDRFRDRLMIPIHDLQGRVIGFGGRSLGDEQPKYLNSPETELFDKGKTLFALDKARAAIAKQDQAIVVEGYFDAIALHAAGITNVVASLGTALSAVQVKQLLRYSESKQIVFNFDADAAGMKAAERAIGEVVDLAYQGQVKLRVLTIPEGKDPDEYLKTHGVADYRSLLNQAPLWLDWQIQQVLAGQDLKRSDQFQQSIQEIVKLLGNLPNATLRTYYIHHCAGLLSQGDARLALQLEGDLRLQVRGQRWHGQGKKWEKAADYSLREAAEANLLRVYLHCPDYRPAVRDALSQRDIEFSFSHHRFLWRQILEVEDLEKQALAEIQLYGTRLSGVDLRSEAEGSRDRPLDLLDAVQDRCIDFPQEMQQVYHLLQLDEKTKLDILRPSLAIRTAAASLERIMCEKRCRHLLKMWEEVSCVITDVSEQQKVQAHIDYLEETLDNAHQTPDPEQALGQLKQVTHSDLTQIQQLIQHHAPHLQPLEQPEPNPLPSHDSESLRRQGFYQEEYYKEKRYLQQLDEQRCITVTDLIQTPWVQP
ncbi:MAG: DNA primase [Leptolyngbyaceae bacterium]|nr:DNA primase [Leptolyngbyaceae bacterium]